MPAMAQLREVRQQIQSIGKTRQITSAMQRIAFIRMGRAQQRARQLRPYGDALLHIVARVLAQQADYVSPLMAQREPRRIGLIVVATDKGLCGALNQRLLQLAVSRQVAWQQTGQQVSATVLGARGLGTLRRAGVPIVAQATGVADLKAEDQGKLMGAVAVPLHQFIAGEIDELHIASNHFVNTLRYEPTLVRVLPFSRALAALPPLTGDEAGIDFLYEPSPHQVIDALLLRYVETAIYGAIVENAACEQSARMTAMKAATDNADQLIADLTRSFHKLRQEAITRELTEIIGGAAAVQEPT